MNVWLYLNVILVPVILFILDKLRPTSPDKFTAVLVLLKLWNRAMGGKLLFSFALPLDDMDLIFSTGMDRQGDATREITKSCDFTGLHRLT